MYANTLIEVGDKKYNRGDLLPDDVDGIEELVEWGSAVETRPEPQDITPPDPLGRLVALREALAAGSITPVEFQEQMDDILGTGDLGSGGGAGT